MFHTSAQPLRVTIVLIVLLLLAGAALAQRDSEPATLIDVSFGDNFVISVPDDWIIYRRQDYPNMQDATAFLQQTYESIVPGIPVNQMEVQTTEFLAIRPEPFARGLVRVSLMFFPLATTAQAFSVSPEDLTAELMLEAVGVQSMQPAEVNGRTIAVSYNVTAQVYEVGAAYVFPELGTVVIATFPVPPDYAAVADGLMHAILLSLRLQGEPFSVEAWEAFFFNNRDFPDVIQPPAAGETGPAQAPDALATDEPAADAAPITAAELMAVCPDGPSEIMFISDRDGNLELYIANADGTNVRRVTTTDVDEEFASWSPDGTQIVYHANPGDPDVFLMNADGTNVRNLTNNPRADWLPRFSPDGAQIAFYSLRDGRDEIYVMNADGSDVRQLTNNPGGDQFPSWSPDGTQIAYAAQQGGDAEIVIVNADGSNPRQLTSNTADDLVPVWSPDGTRILFFSNRDGDNEIFTMQVDGSDLRQLTDNEANDVSTSWSPDGAFILFSSDLDGDRELYVMRADGSGVLQLTDNDADDNTPMWRPCAPAGDAVPPVPTEQATTEPAAVDCTITAPSNVNLRGGPGTTFNVQGTFASGTSLTATGQAVGADGQVWWQLDNGAWVRSDVVNETGNCEALPTVAS